MSLRRNAALARSPWRRSRRGAAPRSRTRSGPGGLHATLGYDTDDPELGSRASPAHPDPDAVRPARLRAGPASGGGAPANGSGAPDPTGRNLTTVIYQYWDGVGRGDARTTRASEGDQEVPSASRPPACATSTFYVVGTPENIANLDGAPTATPRSGAACARARSPTEDGLEAAGTRPAFAWVTATPHGGESAAGESITRQLYELLARTDCENARRLQNLDLFMHAGPQPGRPRRRDPHDGVGLRPQPRLRHAEPAGERASSCR